MATGNFENWAGNIADIGPIYPFVGSEGLLVIIGLASWIAWHIIQAKQEKRAYDEEIERFGSAETLKRMINKEDPEHP